MRQERPTVHRGEHLGHVGDRGAQPHAEAAGEYDRGNIRKTQQIAFGNRSRDGDVPPLGDPFTARVTPRVR